MSRKQKQIFLSDKMPYENDESKIKMSNMLNINKTFDSIIKKDDPKYDKTAAKEYTVRPQFAGPQDSVQKIQAKIMVPQHHRNSQSFIAGLQNPEMKIGKAEQANGGADKRQKSYRNKYNMISISNEIQSQPEPKGQQFQLQRELGNTMKINLQNNRQGGQSQKSHYKDAEMTQLQAYQHFHTPSLNQHRKATQSNFSPMQAKPTDMGSSTTAGRDEAKNNSVSKENNASQMKSNKVMGNCYSLNTSQNECNTPQIKIKVEKKVGSSHSQYARHS